MEKAKADDWTRFKRGLCKSCWATCCHGMAVQVSVPDLIRLGLLTEKEASTSLSRAIRRLREKGILRHTGPRSLVYVLEQKPSGDCIYLNEERHCVVYGRRPEICRQFPRIGPKPGFCPYIPK